MVKMPTRIVIYVKDIMFITGRSERSARQLLGEIKKEYNRSYQRGINIDDFCSFTGFKHETVKENLR